MTERLTIHNFGPIKEADIEIRDLTIFVGPQATGKSLAAQVLYLLGDIESLPLSKNPLPENMGTREELETVLSIMEWWLGNPPSVYADVGTRLRWQVKDAEDNEIYWKQDSVYLSTFLQEKISRIVAQNNKRKKLLNQTYIPAGRLLYSFILPYRLYRFLEQQWPGYILTFYETLGATLDQLWKKSQQEQSLLLSKEDDFFWQRIASIIKGKIQYGPNGILLETANKHLPPTTIAAGQMEIWPFWAIIEDGLQSGTLDSTRIYFEEPEAHLHPAAQRSIMEMVAHLVNGKTQFLLTTHSPYILYAVNNFLMAQKVLDAGRELPPNVPPEVALRPDQVAAYRFDSAGKVHNIMDTEVGLIDETELDQVADDLGATFSDLQAALENGE